jgi:hypothetical protein
MDTSDETKRLSDETKRLSDETKRLSDATKCLSVETKRLSDETKRLSDETKRLPDETKGLSDEPKGLPVETMDRSDLRKGLSGVRYTVHDDMNAGGMMSSKIVNSEVKTAGKSQLWTLEALLEEVSTCPFISLDPDADSAYKD